MEVEAAAQELQCVVHGLVDLLDARAREPLLGVLLLGGDVAGPEEPIAAGVVAEPLELALDPTAGSDPDPRHLGA